MGNYKKGGLEKSKYIINKSDGSKVDPNADYFVMRIDADPNAQIAQIVYMFAVNNFNTQFAKDISNKLIKEYGWTHEMLKNLYSKIMPFLDQVGIYQRTEIAKFMVEKKRDK